MLDLLVQLAFYALMLGVCICLPLLPIVLVCRIMDTIWPNPAPVLPEPDPEPDEPPYPVPPAECEVCGEVMTESDDPSTAHDFCLLAPALDLARTQDERRASMSADELRRQIARTLEFLASAPDSHPLAPPLASALWRAVAEASESNRRALYEIAMSSEDEIFDFDAAWQCIEALALDDADAMRDALSMLDRSVAYETLRSLTDLPDPNTDPKATS